MTDKLKRMQVILVIASILIMLADVSLFASSLIKEDIIVFIIGLIIPTVLLLLSFQVENEFKMEACSSAIYIISMLTYLASFVGTIYLFFPGETYLVIGKVKILTTFLSLLFATLLSLISFFTRKKDYFFKSGFVLMLLTIMTLSTSIMETLNIKGLDVIPGLIVDFIILLLCTLFGNKKNEKFVAIVSVIATFISFIALLDTTDYISIVVPLLGMITTTINIKKIEDSAIDVWSFIGLSVAIWTEIITFGSVLEEGIGLLLSVVLVIIIDMLFCVFNIGKNRKQALGYKIFLDILTIILMIASIDTLEHTLIVITLVLASSLVSTYALKTDKYEQYLLPFKIIMSIIGLLAILNQYINIDMVIIILTINIASVIGYLICQNKVFKYLFMAIIAMSIVFTYYNVDTAFNFIVLSIMYVFNYHVFFILNNECPKGEAFFFVLTDLFLITNIDLLENSLFYLAFAVIMLIVHFIRKDKPFQILSWVAATAGLLAYIEHLPIETLLSTALCEVTVFASAFYIIKKYKLADASLIILMIALGLFVAGYSELIGYLVLLFELLIVLFDSYQDKKSVFNVVLVETFITIFLLLTEIDEIPLFVYLLLVGAGVITIIYISIKKYLNGDYKKEVESKKEETVKVELDPNVIFCGKCGNKLPKDANFCNRCGNKINK